MKYIWISRRLFLATCGIIVLGALGFYCKDASVGLHIAAIVAAVAGSNAYEKRGYKE